MTAYCQDCNTEIDEALEAIQGRQPCPNCGSLMRAYHQALSDTLAIGSLMHTKSYAAGLSKRKGLKFESKDGDSLSVKLGRFVKLHQFVDHEADRYVKKVVDPVTGDVLRDVDKPLSQHRNRGSAKPREP